MMRIRMAVALAVVVASVMVLPSGAEAETFRSGHIVGGILPRGRLPHAAGGGTIVDCRSMPECRAWLESGCNPALAGRDLALQSSIEDVADLADGKTRRVFRWRGLVPWGGMVVQLWRRDCTEIRNATWRSWEHPGYKCCWTPYRKVFRMPRAAKWMTATATTYNLNIDWTLT